MRRESALDCLHNQERQSGNSEAAVLSFVEMHGQTETTAGRILMASMNLVNIAMEISRQRIRVNQAKSLLVEALQTHEVYTPSEVRQLIKEAIDSLKDVAGD